MTDRFPDKIEPMTLPNAIVELNKAMADLPDQWRRHLLPAIEAVNEDCTRRRRILGLVQDALSQLRLDMKYLMFDLEATRRERDAALERP